MEYLKIWVSFSEIIEPLNDSERGRLFTAMLQYAETETVPEFKGNERFVWAIAKQTIDQARAASERLTLNGSKGGRPKTNGNQTKPNETKQNQTEPNESIKVNINENINKNIKENPLTGIKEKPLTRFSAPTVEQVTEYCRERGNRVDPQRFVDFYASKGWKVGSTPMKDWKAAVRTWEQRDSAPIKTVSAQQYQQRDYKADDLSKLADSALAEARRLKAVGE